MTYAGAGQRMETMPAHYLSQRMEVYMYFEVAGGQRGVPHDGRGQGDRGTS